MCHTRVFSICHTPLFLCVTHTHTSDPFAYQVLHVLALCDDSNDRKATLELLLRYSPDDSFREPYQGNTPLHVFAREGFSEICVRLIEHSERPTVLLQSQNDMGNTPLQVATQELLILETEGDASTAKRRERLSDTVQVMEGMTTSY